MEGVEESLVVAGAGGGEKDKKMSVKYRGYVENIVATLMCRVMRPED